jgi:hypothetical protein
MPEKDWFDTHIIVTGLSDERNAELKAALKKKLAEDLAPEPNYEAPDSICTTTKEN